MKYRSQAVAFGFISLAFLAILGCQSPAGDSPAKADPITPVVTPDKLFAAYHISTNEVAQAEGYNPFGRKVVQLQPRRELFITGQLAEGRLVNLWDDFDLAGNPDPKTPLLTYGSSGTPVFANKPHASAAGDLDGDGLDEVVIAYFTGTTNTGKNTGKVALCIMGKGDTMVTTLAIPGNPDFTYCIRNQDYLQGRMDVALGDVDGDGLKEIGIVVGETFVLLDDKKAEYAKLYTKDFRGSGQIDGAWSQVNWYVHIDAGDVNGDGRDEFAAISGYWCGADNVYATAKYSVIGGLSPGELYNGTVNDESGTAEILFGNVAVGDLNGDGIKEICFSGIGKRTQDTLIDGKVITAWWTGTGFKMPGGGKTLSHTFSTGRDQYRPMPTSCFRATVGLKDSLLALNRVIAYSADTSSLSILCNLPESPSVAPDCITNCEIPMATGDVDRDGIEEIVVVYPGVPKTVSVYKAAGSGALSPQNVIPTTVNPVAERSGYLSLCLPDWDGDSITLSFVGSSVKYTVPKVLVVIASPPYWADLLTSDSFSNYSTSYGTSQGESYDRTDTFKISTQISYKEGLDEFGFGASYGAALGASFAHTKGYSTESVMSQVQSTAAGEDKVLYESVPFDVYRFTVLSHPNPAKVGTEYTINVPRRPKIQAMELGAFNALPHNPVTIDAAFLDHTMGNPLSYPNKTAMRTLLTNGGFWNITPTPAGRTTNGSSTSSMDQKTSVSDGFAVGASVKVFGEVSAFWRTLGVENTFDYEWNSTVSTSAGTTISGTIPDIPVSAPGNKDFTYGIALYTKTLKSQGDPVMVVSYWVNPE